MKIKKTMLILFMLISTFLVSTGMAGAAIPPLAGVKVVVDPGHGGWDPGAVGPSGLTEQEVNLRVAEALRNCLLEYGGATVKMTRRDQSYVALSTRAAVANNWGADRFISVHHNGSINPGINGTAVYSYPGGSWKSHHFRDEVQNRLVKTTGLRNLRGQTANFYVLRKTAMPAILTEASFITNPAEEKKLRDPGYTWREAYSIYRGMADHISKVGK